MINSEIHPSERLKRLRENLSMSQRELAQEFNVSNAAIAQWELGSNPIPGLLIKLIEIYEQNPNKERKDHEKFLNFFNEKVKEFETVVNEINVIKISLAEYLVEESSHNSIKAKFKYALMKKFIGYLSKQNGLTIKAIQLASYLEMGLPAEVRLAFGNLQSSMKPMPKKVLIEIIELAYGKSYEEIFPTFNLKPIAVTSLGQVHYAKLKNGKEVAVKIQQKDIKSILDSQFKKMSFLEKLGSYIHKDISIIGDEIRRAVLKECDYLEEARNQNKIKSITLNYPRVIIPQVHLGFTKINILVSEFIHAENFVSFSKTATQASKNHVAGALIKTLSNLSFVHGMILTDVHPENFLIKNDKVVLLDFGRISNPPPVRMRSEIMFYRHFLLNEKKEAEKMAAIIGFNNNDAKLDFEEFWNFLKVSHKHLLKDEVFTFNRDYLKFITNEIKKFSKKQTLKVSVEAFWAFTFSAGVWALLAELDSECNWHRIIMDSLNEALEINSNY